MNEQRAGLRGVGVVGQVGFGEDFTRGNFKEAHRVDVSALNEPQGEAVVFGAGNTLYIGGEGGGKKQPGTLAALSCAP